MKPDPRIPVSCTWLIPGETRAELLAADYATAFTSEPGKRVLADLMAKYGPQRPRFPKGKPADPVAAATIDGEAGVIVEILSFIQLGRAFPQPTNITPNNPTIPPCQNSTSKSTPPDTMSSPDTIPRPAAIKKGNSSSRTTSAKSSSRKKGGTTE